MNTEQVLPNGISDLEKSLAKQHTGHFAWPTLLLALTVFSLFLFTIWQCIQGNWSLWLGLPINTLLAYMAFTPMHDAMHGAISGVKGKKTNMTWIDQSVGWLCTLVLTLPFTYRALHLRHHTHTNDPENDVDFYSHSDNALHALSALYRQLRDGLFIIKTMIREPYYRQQLNITYLWFGFQLSIVLLAMVIGYGIEAFTLWVIPGLLGTTLLSVLFQWLPHHPHSVKGRYTNTRITLFPGGTLLLLGQNTHLIHHMFPRIPFYRYFAVFKVLRPELEQRGSPIQGKGW